MPRTKVKLTYCLDCEADLLPEEMSDDVCAICQEIREEFLEEAHQTQVFESPSRLEIAEYNAVRGVS